jgi:iron complex outermembrane receptor protein
MIGVSLNNGSTVGDKGYINYTVDFSKVNLANRPGTVDAAGEAGDFWSFNSDVQALKKNQMLEISMDLQKPQLLNF